VHRTPEGAKHACLDSHRALVLSNTSFLVWADESGKGIRFTAEAPGVHYEVHREQVGP
jgi:hypothetical protein